MGYGHMTFTQEEEMPSTEGRGREQKGLWDMSHCIPGNGLMTSVVFHPQEMPKKPTKWLTSPLTGEKITQTIFYDKATA